MSLFSPLLLIAGISAFFLTIIVQPFLLKASATACGEKTPSWFTAFFALIAASIASFFASVMYSFTFGTVLASISVYLGYLGAFVTSAFTTSLVYSAILRIGFSRGVAVTGVYYISSAIYLAGIAGALKLLSMFLA